jgi:hypothetical protein
LYIAIVWVIEFIELLGSGRVHPLSAECPICHQTLHLHYDGGGRRHLISPARARSLLYIKVSLRRALSGRTSDVSAQATWPSLILIRTKISNLNCQSPLNRARRAGAIFAMSFCHPSKSTIPYRRVLQALRASLLGVRLQEPQVARQTPKRMKRPDDTGWIRFKLADHHRPGSDSMCR